MGHTTKSEEDLTGFERKVIRFIAVNGPSRIADIAMHLGTSSSAVARTSNRLNLDWTYKDSVQSEKRSYIKLHCTDEGRELGRRLEEEADDSMSLTGMMNALQDDEE